MYQDELRNGKNRNNRIFLIESPISTNIRLFICHRYLNDEPIIFQSVSTARATLDVAHQYLCSDLARFAINYLEENLDSSTVLEIYENLNLYANSLSPSTSQDNDMEESSNRPSAPPASEDEASEIGEFFILNIFI